MTPAEFAYHVRFMTRTNSTTFTDAEILSLMKIRQDEIAKDIIDADEDILLVPQYTNLFADQREYAMPLDLLASIKRVEAKLDGTNYIKLDEIDIASFKNTVLSETLITQNFSNEQGNAFYDLSRKSIYIYSGTITNVTNGLRAWANAYPATITNLASTTEMSTDPSITELGMPRELHEIWARGVIIDYKSSRDQPIPLTEREMNYFLDKQTAINSLMPQNRDRVIIAPVAHNDGSQY